MRFKLLFIFAALFTAAIALAGVRAYAVLEGSSADVPSQDKGIPNQVIPNVSGVPYPEEQPEMKDFIIGLKGPGGYCETLKVSAQSRRDALLFAHQHCPTCNLDDLTGEYVQAEAPWEITPRAQAFCLAR